MNSQSVSDITEEFAPEEAIPEEAIPETEEVIPETEEVIPETEEVIRENQSNISGKRSYKSEVWKYFDKVEWRKERRAARCKLSNCKKVFSCGSGGTTMPLWCHLESAHWTRYVMTEEYRRKRQKTQKECNTVEAIFKKVSFLLFFLCNFQTKL